MFYLVPESGTRQKLVPDCMTHVPDSGTSFLVPVSGTSFWSVCHGYNDISRAVERGCKNLGFLHTQKLKKTSKVQILGY